MKRSVFALLALLWAMPLSAQRPIPWDSLQAPADSILARIARYRLIPPVVDTVQGGHTEPGVYVDTLSVSPSVTVVRVTTVVVDSVAAPPDTTATSVQVAPGSGPSITPGDTIRFLAQVLDSSGVPRAWAVEWTVSPGSVARIVSDPLTDPETGTVTQSAVATGAAPGLATVTAAVGSVSGDVTLEVREPEPPPPAEWDSVLVGSYGADVVVPEGERWLVGQGVQIQGNLRTVGGTIAMRPGSSLTFLGADPLRYVGGGLTYSPAFANDIGLWVTNGVLDISCTPKASWNRTGVDSTWMSTDEYWIAPTAVGDFAPRRWNPGDPIPQADPRVPAAEVANVTRDCTITGPAHIHVHSDKPQRIEYVRLQGMGVMNPGPTSGRYALHLHMSGDGSRGTIIRGVAAVGSRGRVFVPHASNGVTLIDNVSVNSAREAFWWDTPDVTADVLVDRLAVLGVNVGGSGTMRVDGIALPGGSNTEIRNSAVSGVYGNKLSTGFRWPDGDQTPAPRVWRFDQGNVSHNNRGTALRFWTNLGDAHVVRDFTTYRNGIAGIENGAYQNGVEYHAITSIEEGVTGYSGEQQRSAVLWHSNARRNDAGVLSGIRGATLVSRIGPALLVGNRQLGGSVPSVFEDCSLTAQAGFPKVLIEDGNSFSNPWNGSFVRCNLTPEDIAFQNLAASGTEGSRVRIENADGSGWDITVVRGRKVVVALPERAVPPM